MGIPLFIATPTGTCRLSLHRFRLRGDSEHLHNASVVIDEDAPVTPVDPDGMKPVTDARVPHDDPRWPSRCECREPFTDADQWQVNELDWYEGGGQRFAWGVGSWDGPPGAMIRARWRDRDGRPPAWIVFLPNGTRWCTNDTASGGGGYWDVTGEAPRITVSPSINDQGSRPWHGWIRDGEMTNA